MKKNWVKLVVVFVVMNSFVFGARSRVENQLNVGVSFGDLGVSGEYIIKKPTINYGGGVFVSYDDYSSQYYYHDHYYEDDVEIGAYGIIGLPIQKKVNLNFKLGLASKTYSNDHDDYSHTVVAPMVGVGLGYEINSLYEVSAEANSSRGLVLHLGFRM